MKIVPVILSGGFGTRLWPLSSEQYPKQYLPLIGKNTMLQKTILRLNGLSDVDDPIIVCNIDHRFLVAEQCQQINIKNPTILLEPIGRNTAPAIAAAALQVLKNKDKVLLVLSADHIIQNIDAFHQAIKIANIQAQKGRLVTFGIVPDDANTEYGYIKFSKSRDCNAYTVEEFVEKPNLKTAKSYISKGNYLWNSGMFMFKAGVLIDELSVQEPDIVSMVKFSVDNADKDLCFVSLDKNVFATLPSNSIDYALMEKSNNVMVVSLDAGWSDIGAWSELYDISDKDNNGNVIKGDVIVQDTSNSFINTNHRKVVAIGIDDLVIVSTKDVLMISHKDSVENIKVIVKQLKNSSREEWKLHNEVHRPWGKYDLIDNGENYLAKRITVKPGAKLSVQMHNHRAEHWIVVSGEARVTNGDKVFLLSENESTYIPVGVVHALENLGKVELELIEVQSGNYLSEDDIVRFEDVYGRSSK